MRDGADLGNLPPKARLHIGHLKEDANKENLRAKFAKYGRIYELYMNPGKGFAFIQYGSCEEATDAIRGEDQSIFEGVNIAVKLANKDKFGNPINKDDMHKFPGSRGQDRYLDGGDRDRSIDHFHDRERGLLDRPLRSRERSPLRDLYEDRYRDRFDRRRDLYDRDDVRRRDPYYEDRLGPSRDRYDDRYLSQDDYRREAAYRDRDRERERDRRDPANMERRDILDRDKEPRDVRDAYDRRAPPLDSAGPPPLPPTDKPIDCEILLLGKHLRDYADVVERRIKALALNTGLLLISNEASLPQALEDVTRRNVLYAVILTSQNEVHRSVTLNILHGSPQEHRNMPLEDALALVDRNFTTYLQDRGLPSKGSSSSTLTPGPVPAPLPGEPPLPKTQPPVLPPTPKPAVPPAPSSAPAAATALAVPAVELTIPQLINLLADRKQLTLGEMDRVISHLQAVRRKMAVEQGVNPEPPAAGSSASTGLTQTTQLQTVNVSTAPVKEVDKKQAELQAKILSIFSPSGASLATTTSTALKTTAPISSLKVESKQGSSIPYSYGTTVNVTSQATKKVASKSGTDINLDSPVVQKVLDKLIQSGPTMLKQLATSANSSLSSSTQSKTQASNKASKDSKSRVQISKPPMSKEESDAQLRAAQTAALKMLQAQEAVIKAKQAQQTALQQNQTSVVAAAVQNPYPQPLMTFQLSNPYQQQQSLYQQQQQQQQQQQMVQYPQQHFQPPQQPNVPLNGPAPRALFSSPSHQTMRAPLLNNPGSGWQHAWKQPGATAGNPQGLHGNQFASQQHNAPPTSQMAYYQQQSMSGGRSQPTPPGI